MENLNITLISLNVGKPRTMIRDDEEIFTGIQKDPVEGLLTLSKTNFEGDGQADLVNHGGEDKAVCVYPFEHYSYWEKELQIPLQVGAFGENLTAKGITEEMVHIGDIFQFGTGVVQISQPRQPCYKLAKRYNIKELPILVQNTGYTGFYFRVLEEGQVEKGSPFFLLEKDSGHITIDFANRIMHHDKDNVDAIKEILKVEALSKSWRQTFEKRLKGVEVNTSKRLEGK